MINLIYLFITLDLQMPPKAKRIKIEDLDLKAENLTINSPTTSRAQSPSIKSKAANSSEETKTQISLNTFFKSEKSNKDTMTQGLKLLDLIAQKRTSLFKNVLDFKFNKKRVRVLTSTDEMSETSNGVLYWMTREQRVQGK